MSIRRGYYYKTSSRRTCLRLADARLCPSCEVIFEADACPLCGSESFVPVSKWIEPLQPAALSSGLRRPETGSQGSQRARPRDPVSMLVRLFAFAVKPTER